jgi:ATP-dependent DNA helicase DinG
MKDITGLSCSDIFPKGFTPRPNQVKCIDQALDYFRQGGKFVVINAPTGSGKSFISTALAEVSDEPSQTYKDAILSYKAFDPKEGIDLSGEASGCFVLTTTKTLQDQYLDTFEDGFVLKGKSNYQCTVDPEAAVDFAPCVITPKLKKQCWAQNSCPYYKSRNNVLVNKLSFLNYSMFFHLQDDIKGRTIIVCDEASEIEEELVKAFSVNITYKHLDSVGVDYTKLEDENAAKGWFTDLQSVVNAKYEAMMEECSKRKDLTQKDTIKLRYLTQLNKSLEKVLNHWGFVEYVIEKDDKTIQAIPLKVDYLAQNLFSYAEKVVMMSATIIDHANFARTLGIKDYKYIEVDSTFDPKKSPIYCSDKFPLSYKTMEANLPKVIDLAKMVVDKHHNEKGIIHTFTFAITEKLKRKVNGKRFLYREEGVTNEDLLTEHAMRTDATVLISPSMAFGVDLKDDAARWQIIMKMPYPSLASKRVKKLAELDQRWYIRKMLTTFVQMCGRSTRSEDDHSVTYVLDGSIINIMQRHREILPKYFLQRFM